ncbi:MAG: TerC family protein [Vicinamibacterales bacterium]
MPTLFPFAEYWSFYAAFTACILALLALDLGVFHRNAHAVTFRESVAWSVVWVAAALLFNAGLFVYAGERFGDATGRQIGLEFLTGYLVEKSLAVDNVFVFVLVFTYFSIPLQYQHRVLFYGILGALVLRGIFVAIGSVLMQYHAVVVFFGVLLVVTGIKMIRAPERQMDPEANPVVRLLRRLVPVTPELHGARFLVKLGGRWHATPLLVALVFLELSDVVFAVDSVPAIFAVTREPLIVFTSNVFAILGLRSMYFLLAGAVERFHMLKYGLALILVFVGSKMAWLNAAFGGKFPTTWSLGVITALLAGSVVASLWWPRRPAGRAGTAGVGSAPSPREEGGRAPVPRQVVP